MRFRSVSISLALIAILILVAGVPTAVAAPEDAFAMAKSLDEGAKKINWDQDYIEEVPPIMMIEPYLYMFGQVDEPISYTFEEVVKLSGHSCGATAGAFVITRKALDYLYSGDELPVRGQIRVDAPGAEGQWYLGVFGDIIMYITGAAPESGFTGAEFGEVNDLFVRRNKLVYTESPTPTPPPQMRWVFERLDTGEKVSVQYNLSLIQPVQTPAHVEMGRKMALGQATPQEAADYIHYWNARVKFVFQNADTLEGFFILRPVE